MPALLVSVATVDEARLALEAGADLIDAKDPKAGALGALDQETVGDIARAVAGRAVVTAVTGDHHDMASLIAAAETIAETGVDMVKVGLYPGLDTPQAVREIGQRLAPRCRLVAVLLADHNPDLSLVDDLAAAGFTGVMLDTFAKGSGLLSFIKYTDIRAFVARAKQHDLICGLAGSLKSEDLSLLYTLGADLLGMRGGLCRGHDRTSVLQPDLIAEAVALVHGKTPQQKAG
ncbi:hypothetical protein HDIA_2298 [Hartmannibacter diazotrophicus]|uniref:(5-formylfuran-3-yl)methyl phosphate synthase n=1 Tax=Hartmannibacter diazotrophicus TaxID=1482074 RepID=A0A2C9D6N6_9HYPH|nr:(5-formylfuran-3-yl)methyl phosphate synthase [Hartmannibacter diazotrophicus]SON55839.1 hypothetical protein HDIA_2298 [Hartmannibacter diazotrophicus]